MKVRADLSLVLHALKLGYTVSVYDEDNINYQACAMSSDATEIIKCIDAVGHSGLTFHKGAEHVGWALVIVQGEDDENVSDYSISDRCKWIDEWFNNYEGE